MPTYNNFDSSYSDEDEYIGDTLSAETIRDTCTYMYRTFGIVQKRIAKPLVVTDAWLDVMSYIQKLPEVTYHD